MGTRATKDDRSRFLMRLNRRFQFEKSRQLFIRSHNETLSVVAVRVCNPDRSPLRINRRDAAPTPTGFAEVVCDDFPVFHANHCVAFGLRKASETRFRFVNAE
jgi:hypothetical protein